MKIPATLKFFVLFLSLQTFYSVNSQSQTLPESFSVKADSLLQQWNRTDGPGCIAGVVIGDKLVYSKSSGLANLEQPAPITPESMFYMCSVSKQFTGYAIAQLIEEGKVKADDDIHLYLPWLKDFGSKITISNLLNHTSGLHDDIALSRLFGLNSDGILTQDLALKIIGRQRSLNFHPGDKYAYSNTNYVLLSEIVKHVSGMSFRAYADSAIFKPLGMNTARFVDDPNELIPNRASSYLNVNGIWKNSLHNVYTLGDGGMFCSAADMARWAANFWSTDSRSRRVIAVMSTSNTLNNGKPNNYTMGINIDPYKGHKTLSHNGALAGYRTIISIFPEDRVAVFSFVNDRNNAIYGIVNQIADLILPKTATPPASKQQSNPLGQPVSIDSIILKKYAGTYISSTGLRVDLRVRNGKLHAGPNELTATSPSDFYMNNRPDTRFKLEDGKMSLTGEPEPLTHTGPTPDTEAALKEYTGTYFSEELANTFTVRIEGGKLVMDNARLGQSKLSLRGKDHLFAEYDMMKHLLVNRDQRGQVIGFNLNDEVLTNIVFRKQ